MEEFRWGCRVQTGWTEDWQALRPLVLTGADIPEDRPPGRVFSLAQATEQGVWAAALAARAMGLKMDGIIAAENSNDYLTRLLATGAERLPHRPIPTLASACDKSMPTNTGERTKILRKASRAVFTRT